MLRSFPELARRLGHAKAADDARARGPLHVQVPTPARNGLLLVGDAAGYVDAITGEGVGLAISKASTMASLLRPALARPGGQVTLAELEPFLRAARKADRSHVELTRALAVAAELTPGDGATHRSASRRHRAVSALSVGQPGWRFALGDAGGVIVRSSAPPRAMGFVKRSLARGRQHGCYQLGDRGGRE